MELPLTVVTSPYEAAVTHDRLVIEIGNAGNAIFADLDQAALARNAGLDLRPTFVLLFGNPKAGTAIMASSAPAAYELPLKLLVWSEDGATYVAYRAPSAIGAMYGVSGIEERLTAMDSAVAGIIKRALS